MSAGAGVVVHLLVKHGTSGEPIMGSKPAKVNGPTEVLITVVTPSGLAVGGASVDRYASAVSVVRVSVHGGVAAVNTHTFKSVVVCLG